MENYVYIYIYAHAQLLQLCPTLCDPMNCSLPGFSAHGILQARILGWVALPFSRVFYKPWEQTRAPIHICVHIYMYVCVCVYEERERKKTIEITSLFVMQVVIAQSSLKGNFLDYASFLQSQQIQGSVVMLRRMLHVPQFMETSSLENGGVKLISLETHRECHAP